VHLRASYANWVALLFVPSKYFFFDKKRTYNNMKKRKGYNCCKGMFFY
jgi:hypothetical protein